MLLLSSVVGLSESRACTSAIISAQKSASGRPLLWKHRDTSNIDNKVEYVASDSEGGFPYVALFNSQDSRLEEAWMGMNDHGFAVMNTASYNIKDDKVSQKDMDREGFLMTMALRTCVTVDDFERLLSTLPRPMGVEANFGVIDALGNGAYFETNNHSFTKFDLKDSKDGVLVRTNYSHSGRPGEGYGQIREANACKLIAPLASNGKIHPEDLTETLSRSFYHNLKGKDALESEERWAVDQDFIPRYKSTATIVIEGCPPLSSADMIDPQSIVDNYIMWTGLGYPPCSEIVPVWCHPSGVARDLRGSTTTGTSPMCDKVKQRRSEVFPPHPGSEGKYIDLSKLKNGFSSGYIQVLVPANLKVYEMTRRRRESGQIHFPY